MPNKRINHDAAARRGLCAGRWVDRREVSVRTIAIGIAVMTALLLVGCGSSKGEAATATLAAAPQPLLRVFVSPWRVEADGQRVSLAELESRLEALQDRSGFITLNDESETHAPLPLTDAQAARMNALNRKVLSLAERYGLHVGWPPASNQGG